MPIALLRAREKVMGPIRQMLAGADITEQQWRVLRVLDEGGAMEPTGIAARACLMLPSLTRILQNLDAKGMITRTADQQDRRKQVIEITPTGSKLIAENLETSVALTAELQSQMGPERYELLLDLLNELDQLKL